MTNLIERDIRWSCFEAKCCCWLFLKTNDNNTVASLEFISWAQENKIVCQLKNEMKLVLTAKLSRYKDWYETTNFDAERINWNDRNFAVPMLFQIWNEFVSKLNYYCCYLLQGKRGRRRHCTVSILRLGRSKKFQSCVQIFMTSVIDNVLVKVLIHDK